MSRREFLKVPGQEVPWTDEWARLLFVFELVRELGSGWFVVYGEAGLGKTHQVIELAMDGGLPWFLIPLSDDLPMHYLIGYNELVNGETVWREGILSKALRTPNAVIILDELWRVSADVEALLMAIIQDARFGYMLPTGERLVRAEGVVICATQNADPSALNEALRSRFPVRCRVTTPNPSFLRTLTAEARDEYLKSQTAQRVKPVSLRPFADGRTWQFFSVVQRLRGLARAYWATFGAEGREMYEARMAAQKA